jgi:homoserine kinase type II
MRRANSLSLSGWAPLFDGAKARADEITPGLAAFITDELAALAKVWPQSLPQGVIHADLFPDNVFFLDKHLSGLIDFYFACTDALAYDAAICLNAWCFEPDASFNVTKGQAFLAGYQSVRALDAQEIAALPVLARGAALRFLLTRLVDWLNVPVGALVRPKDPMEYVKKLRFHQKQSIGANTTQSSVMISPYPHGLSLNILRYFGPTGLGKPAPLPTKLRTEIRWPDITAF